MWGDGKRSCPGGPLEGFLFTRMRSSLVSVGGHSVEEGIGGTAVLLKEGKGLSPDFDKGV